MPMDMRCLYSTVRNVSGGTRTFSFLPPHGRKMTADEEYSVMGDIVEACIRDQRVTSRRQLAALETAVHDQLLSIVSTPAQIFEDEGTGQSKMLHVANGTLALTDPCWESVSDSVNTDE